MNFLNYSLGKNKNLFEKVQRQNQGEAHIMDQTSITVNPVHIKM